MSLRFRADRTFTIVQLTDVHWKNGEPEDQRTRALIEGVLDRERPDLVALTGDIVDGEASREPAEHQGGKLPALAFFHIPLPEYDEVWRTALCRGSRHEPVCAPSINSGFFAALVEAGDVMGTFAGHDHVNDFEGELHGIRLCYGRASGFSPYGREGFERGARVIQLQEGERAFRTWLRLADGSRVEQAEHEPEAWARSA